MILWNNLVCVLLALFIVHVQADAQQNKADLFSQVNGPADEQHPLVSPDGQTLFFTRAHHELNVGGARDEGDIWYSTLQENNQWSSPKNLTTLNNNNWNGVVGISEDGLTLYLMGHYRSTNGIIRTQGIAKSHKKGNSWTSPEDVEIPYFKNKSNNFGAYVSSDESVMVLALESYGTEGAEDIYVCLRGDNGKWTDPKNLGKTINSKFQELTPYLSADKRTLYFSSNGLGGEGSSDVMSAQRHGEGWKNWSTPLPVKEINSSGRELGYKTFGGYSIYTSTISSDGYGDIKIFTPYDLDSVVAYSETEKLDSLQLVEVSPDVAIANPNDITLYGKVFDAESHQELKAEITISQTVGKKDKNVNTSANSSYYSLSIKSAGEYNIRVDAPGYVSHQEDLNIFSKEVKLLEMNFDLQPIRVGATVNLENVLFKQSTPAILQSSYSELLLVVDLMKKNPSVKIRLEGHTDNRGSQKGNLKLSKSRAKAVMDYLTAKGISPRRISWKGYGGANPIADNDDPETRKMNRRVEFTIIKK